MRRRIPQATESVREHLAATQALQRSVLQDLDGHASREELRDYGTVRDALARTSGALAQHAAQLHGELEGLGGHSALERTCSELQRYRGPKAGRISILGAWPVSGLVRDDAVSLSSVVSSLTVLHSLALARNVESVAATAARQLQETTELMVALHLRLSELVVDESARREPIAPAPDARGRAHRQVRHAWSGVLRPA